MKISEIMSGNPVVGSPGETLQQAAEYMDRLDCGFLPVGENDRLVGALTDRDIAVRGVARGRGPDTTIGEILSEEVLYCFSDDECETVANNMGDQQVRRLPVVDRDKRLVGIVSLGDLAGAVTNSTGGQALEEVSEPGGLHG